MPVLRRRTEFGPSALWLPTGILVLGVEVYAHHTYTGMTIEFDPAKDEANVRKHGVSLAEGDGVLLDPLALTVEDTANEGEQRWQTIGSNSFGEVMIVVWTHRGQDIRVISVRRPEPQERRDYEEAG